MFDVPRLQALPRGSIPRESSSQPFLIDQQPGMDMQGRHNHRWVLSFIYSHLRSRRRHGTERHHRSSSNRPDTGYGARYGFHQCILSLLASSQHDSSFRRKWSHVLLTRFYLFSIWKADCLIWRRILLNRGGMRLERI